MIIFFNGFCVLKAVLLGIDSMRHASSAGPGPRSGATGREVRKNDYDAGAPSSTMTDDERGREGGPADPVRSYQLAPPGPFGDPWTAVRLGPDSLTLVGEAGEATVPYSDLRGVESVSVREVHDAKRISLDLVVLGSYLVLTGGVELARRLSDRDLVTPAGLTRYANEVVATEPLVRLRLDTDGRSHFLYAGEATAGELADALEGRVNRRSERTGDGEREGTGESAGT